MSGAISPTSRFEITTRLYVGGMAEVFLAVQRAGGVQRRVVVKRMLPELAAHEEMRARFSEEAHLLARLAGPGLPALIDAGEDAEGPYLVLQYLEGVNLREALLKTAPFSERDAAAVLCSALEILARLHAARGEDDAPLHFVHRDLAPENLQLCRDGTLWLLDLGLAKSRASAVRTAAGVRQGRLSYMAPEQVRGESASPAADVYALGVVAAELLGALSPLAESHEATPSAALLERLSNQGAWGRLDWPHEVSEKFRHAIETALSPQADARPDARGLREQLVPLAAGADLAARCEAALEGRAAPRSGRVTPRLPSGLSSQAVSKKFPLVPALALGAIAAVVFVWVGATWLVARAPRKEPPAVAVAEGPVRGRLVLVPPSGGPYELTVDGRFEGTLSKEKVLVLSSGAHTVVLTDPATSRYYREDFLLGENEERTLRFPLDTVDQKIFGGMR